MNEIKFNPHLTAIHTKAVAGVGHSKCFEKGRNNTTCSWEFKKQTDERRRKEKFLRFGEFFSFVFYFLFIKVLSWKALKKSFIQLNNKSVNRWQ